MKLLGERGACREVIGEKGARNHNHDDDTSSDPRSLVNELMRTLHRKVNASPVSHLCLPTFLTRLRGEIPHRVLYCYYSQGVELAPQVCKPI